jgi:hypothetical protein
MTHPPAPNAEHDSNEQLNPAAAFALLTDQQRSVANARGAVVPYFALVWGIAYLVGFAAIWAIDGPKPAWSLPVAVAIPLYVVLMVAAIALTAVLGIRMSRGFRPGPEASFTGTVYGLAWPIGLIGLTAIGAGLQLHGLSDQLAYLFYPSAYVFFVGVMHLAAAAIWRAPGTLFVGVWSVVVAAIAPFLGYPGNSLFIAIAAGGGFIVLFFVLATRIRRSRRQLSEFTRG